MKLNAPANAEASLFCPICSTESANEASFDDIYLYRCPECDHCFTDQSRLKKFEQYSDDYYEDSHKNWNLHPNFAYFGQLEKIIRTRGPQQKIIDIGCGKGEFLKYLRAHQPQYELIGIDVSANEPANGISFLQGDFLKLNLNLDFSVLVSLAAIEHVSDVQSFVERLSRACRPDGVVIVMTLDDRSLMYEMSRLLFRIGIQTPFKRLYSRHHLHHFNASSLVRLMEQHGLRVDDRIRHNIPLAAVDMPRGSLIKKFVLFVGVAVSFFLGQLTGRTYLQTLVCTKTRSPKLDK